MMQSHTSDITPSSGRYLRALAVIAAPVRDEMGTGPPGGAPLNVWGRWSRLKRAVERAGDPVTGEGAPWALVRLHPPTQVNLKRTLHAPPAGHPYHVLHFVGHGCPEGLWMESDLGHERLAHTDALVRMLAGRGLYLAVLSACATEPTARALHERAGIPALVAMREPVYETEAGVFDRHLYAALARGLTVGEAFDAAVDGLRRAYLEGQLAIPPEGHADPAAYITSRLAIPALVGDPATRLPLPPPGERAREPFITLSEPPHDLPYASLLPGFIGRGEELSRIARWMKEPDRPLFAVSGIGGVGKSALATMAALRGSFRFQAIVYASAHAEPERFLTTLLEKIDARLAPGSIVSQPTRAAREVAALDALKRTPTLLLLDNLEALDRRTTTDLADFLGRLDPRTGTLALCTLRPARKDPLTDLAGPCALGLERLDPPVALRLLAEQLTRRDLWNKVEPAGVRPTQREELADLARRAFLRDDAEALPLVAALWELAQAAGRHPKLLLLALGDLHTAPGMTWPKLLRRLRTLPGRHWQERVKEMVGVMVEELAEREPEAADLLMQVALFPAGAPDWALAYVHLGEWVEEEDPRRVEFEERLRTLAEASLLNWGEGRYDLHPLVARYAERRPASERETWRRRQAETFLAYARAHSDDYDALEAEWPNLRAGFDFVADEGTRDDEAVQDYTWAVDKFLDTRGYWDEDLRWLLEASKACEELGDRAGLATTYNNIALIYDARGDYDGALEWYEKSVPIFGELGDRAGLATTYNNIAAIHHARGDYDAALEWYEKSVAITEELGHRAGLAVTFHNMGHVALAQGDLRRALALFTRSRDLYAEIGLPRDMAEEEEMIAEVRGRLNR